MSFKSTPSRSRLLWLLVLLVAWTQPLLADDKVEASGLVDRARVTLNNFAADPNIPASFKDKIKQAKAVLIVPQVLKAGFLIGASGGTGVMLSRNPGTGQWSYPAFYTMGSVSFGLQIGGQAAEVILLAMTDKAVNAFLSTKFQLGGDVSVAAGPVGVGAQAGFADIFSYSRAKGVFAGISVDGAVIAIRKSLNHAYYDKPVSPVDILVTYEAVNRQADPLRQALSSTGG